MLRNASSIVLVSCLSLLTLQLSGIHRHVDADGYVGLAEGNHTHAQVAHDDHAHSHGVHQEQRAHAGLPDHEDDSHEGADREASEHEDAEHQYEDTKDVSITELSGGNSSSFVFFVWLGPGLLVPAESNETLETVFAVPRLTNHHQRLRPPLRAPPALS